MRKVLFSAILAMGAVLTLAVSVSAGGGYPCC